MNSLLISAFVYIPISIVAAISTGGRRDRIFTIAMVLFAWLFLGIIAALITEWIPFTDGGDDHAYYLISQNSDYSLNNLFDLKRFYGAIEQPGYPWLLSLVSPILKHNLLSYKLLNLLLLIITSLAWYRIGAVIHSARFARVVMLATLCLTPLWYYVFFLLKDMSIVLLQTLFLLGLVQAYSSRSVLSWSLAGSATVALILFRTALVVQNAAVAISVLLVSAFGRQRGRGAIAQLVLTAIVFGGIILIASNQDIMAQFGVYTEQRVVGSSAMLEGIGHYRVSTPPNALFPIVYLLSETSGLNLSTWNALDAAWFRGLLAIPWIIFVVPFFLLGLRWVVSVPGGAPSNVSLIGRLQLSRMATTPWGVLVIFVLSSLAISWMVGDTTRWRIADMPVFGALAVAGWMHTAHRTRALVLILWPVLVISFAVAFYLVR